MCGKTMSHDVIINNAIPSNCRCNALTTAIRYVTIETVDTKQLTAYFKENWKNILPYGFDLIDSEHRLYGSLDENCSKRGVCDYVFKYKHYDFITEVELGYNCTEFWSCFKVVAYREAYLLDNPIIKKSKVKCLVVLNSEIYHPNFRNILCMSGLNYIFLNQNGEVFKCDIEL
jgi:hypothetical protein